MKKNDEIILTITDYTAEGSGVGKWENMAVFVPETAVGDTVRVKILKVKAKYAFGKVTEIMEKSSLRTENVCSAFPRCGGCVFRHISYSAELSFKENRAYETVKRIGGVDLKPKSILFGSESRYRNKAQYPISLDGKAGFFANRSHRSIPCSDCFLEPQAFGDIAHSFEEWIAENGISIYNEEAHKGLVRHLYIRQGAETKEIMVCIVINGTALPQKENLISRLLGVAGESLKSVQLNINTEKTNVVLSDKCQTIYGEDYITDILCGVRIRLSPLSFYQVNHTMAERLYEKVREYAEPRGKVILDLYCGAGTIGLSLAKEAKRIIGVEIVPEAITDAKHNAKANGIENAEFYCSDATAFGEKSAKEGLRADVVILDPPRKGCTNELISTVADAFAPEDIVYVSCDVATLARDIKIFQNMGYKLIEYTPVDLFPRTAHCETVALLRRNTASAI